jgi:hypothetical protein
MLLPVAAVAGAGLVTFRLSISALEEFRRETVEESRRIEEVRDLLVEADDLGEASVEGDDPVTGERFIALRALIDRRFDDLQTLATHQERQLAAKADAMWERSAADIEAAKALPQGATDDRLDPFHDHNRPGGVEAGRPPLAQRQPGRRRDLVAASAGAGPAAGRPRRARHRLDRCVVPGPAVGALDHPTAAVVEGRGDAVRLGRPVASDR